MLANKRGADAGQRLWEATYGVVKSVEAVCHTAWDWRPDLFPLQSYFNTSPSARFLKHSLPEAAPNMCPINARLIQTPLQTWNSRSWEMQQKMAIAFFKSLKPSWEGVGRDETLTWQTHRHDGDSQLHCNPTAHQPGKQGPCGVDWAWARPRRLQFKNNLIIERKEADPERGRNGGERENSCICTSMKRDSERTAQK